MKILALDSGVEKTGWAVLEGGKGNYELLAEGLITTSMKEALPARIARIGEELLTLLKEYQPSQMVMEKLFYFKNQKTIVMVAQAQGAALWAAFQARIGVEFITPLYVKQTLTGYGRATKGQVGKMVKLLLKIEKLPVSDDTVDAIAVGIAYLKKKN